MTESHGTEPLIKALKKPEDWQYFDPLGGAQGEWKDFTIIGGNSNLSLCYFTGLAWRRKPVEKREPMLARAQFSIAKSHHNIGFPGCDNGPSVTVALGDMWWSAKRARITVEEIVEGEAGRAEEQPEQSVKMTAEEATKWLKTPGHAAASDRNIFWRGKDLERGCILSSESTYTPYTVATRSQVELERELAKLTVDVANLNRDLVSALGSQKAAVAALEVERANKKVLRSALEDLLDMVHCEAAQNAERVLNETACKARELAGDG